MKTLNINSTSLYTVDLYALEAYHRAASHDSHRTASKRSWHRQQASIVKDKLSCWDWHHFCRQFRSFPINLRYKQ
jgi:hypothetical protein